MSRANTVTPTHELGTHQHSQARQVSPELRLRALIVAFRGWEHLSRAEGAEIARQIAELVPKIPAEKVAALAIEGREQMKRRDAALLLIREMARHKMQRHLVADTLVRVIQRADDLPEFIAIYWRDGRVPLSSQVKKGLAAAFVKFDENQLAQCGRRACIKLRDVLFLCHAKPRDDAQAAVWKKLIWGRLRAAKRPASSRSAKQ